ncbi:MAG: fibronectin type III domain-containing protein [bacterium]
MPGKQNRKTFLLAALVFSGAASALFAGRFESVSFTELNGDYGQAGGKLTSASFETSATSDETGSSASGSASYAAGSGREKRLPVPARIIDLHVAEIFGSSVTLKWTTPAGDWERNIGDTTRYIVRYSPNPLDTENDFRNAAEYTQNWTPLASGATETRMVTGLAAGTTYYFAVQSINEHIVRSEISRYIPPTPMAPLGLDISLSSGEEVHLKWLPSIAYSNRVRFNSMAAPSYPYELKGYNLYRSTTPRGDGWELIASVSTGTLSWTGTPELDGKEYYYQVRAENATGLSVPSIIRAKYSKSAYVVASDKQSMLEIPVENLSQFIGSNVLSVNSINAVDHPEELVGRVLKSIEFTAYMAGLEKNATLELPGWAYLHLHYNQEGLLISPSAVLPTPDQISVYWYNGSKWVQLYGKLDEENSEILIRTSMLGKYQIRTVERAGGFNADLSGLSNKLITPNGDKKNDTSVFVFDNPRDSAVTGKIYDLKGAFVSDMKAGPVANSLEWDAKAGGQVVSGGVYIYQIESEGKVYNGTMVVIR